MRRPFRAGGWGKRSVAGAAIEHPLEGVAEDPAWVGYKKEKPACAGLTLRVGRG